MVHVHVVWLLVYIHVVGVDVLMWKYLQLWLYVLLDGGFWGRRGYGRGMEVIESADSDDDLVEKFLLKEGALVGAKEADVV